MVKNINMPKLRGTDISTEDDSNTQNICVTCLTQAECEDVFILTFEDTCFNNIFKSCMGFKLSKDSELKYICLECIKTIISFYTFKQTALKSYEELCKKETNTEICTREKNNALENRSNITSNVEFISILNESNNTSAVEPDIKVEHTEEVKEEDVDVTLTQTDGDVDVDKTESDVTSNKTDSDVTLNRKGKINSKEKTVWQCPYCPLSISKDNPAEIKKHRYWGCRSNKNRLRQPVIKTKDILFCCLCCEFKTSSEDEFREHSLNHRGGEFFEVPPRSFGCPKCKYVSPRKGDVQRHLLSHQSDEEAQLLHCKECDFASRYILSLQKHFRRKHQNEKATLSKIYRCDKCQFRTAYSNSLLSHQMKHKSPIELEMFYCYNCDFKTVYKTNLRSHMNLHKNPKEQTKYVCEICGFLTVYKKSHRFHMLAHASEEEKYRVKDE